MNQMKGHQQLHTRHLATFTLLFLLCLSGPLFNSGSLSGPLFNNGPLSGPLPLNALLVLHNPSFPRPYNLHLNLVPLCNPFSILPPLLPAPRGRGPTHTE